MVLEYQLCGTDSSTAATRKCDNLTVLEVAAVDGQSYDGTVFMPPLQSRGAGIDVQKIKRLVVLDLEDMAVTANKEFWRRGINLTAYTRVIVAGISADMFHKHINILALPAQTLGEHKAQVTAVTIAINSTEGAELCQTLCNLHGAYVAGMPNLVARLKIVKILVIPIRMGITDNSYTFHNIIEGVRGS